MAKFLNISEDTTLGGNSPSDMVVSSQKAVKSYVDAHSGGGGSTYTAGDGIDITNNVISVDGVQTSEVELATVATSGSYNDLSNKPTIPTVNNATLTITQGGTTKGTFTANASSDVTIALDSGGGSSRNIGEIVQSTIPLTDAGLHLLDGALISGSGSYSDFVTYIAGLVSSYPEIFDTEANWQSAVTTYGVCGKFVYDSVNNTVRLPKITGFTEGTTDLTALGDLVEQYVKLPNITGMDGIRNNGLAYASGAFYLDSDTTAAYAYAGAYTGDGAVKFDASRCSSVYSGNGSDTKIQPQAIKALYYIVIATSTKTQIEVDIDEVMTDLNGKADTDLSNINASQSAKNTIVNWGMPDYSRAQTLSTGTFTPSSDSIIEIFVDARNTLGFGVYIGSSVDNSKTILYCAQSGTTAIYGGGQALVLAGQTYTFNNSAILLRAIIAPLKGV